MSRDRMQKSRFELKYLIPEETALLVRDFVRSYLDFDEYSVGKPNYSNPGIPAPRWAGTRTSFSSSRWTGGKNFPPA